MPTLSLITTLNKIATDTGFDEVLGAVDGWSMYRSSQRDRAVWLRYTPDAHLHIAWAETPQTVKNDLICDELSSNDLPTGAQSGCAVEEIPHAYNVLTALYNETCSSDTSTGTAFEMFRQRTSMLPRSTEAERLVVQRIGQDLFRNALLRDWGGRCAVTGLAVPELLRASHIKPWARCKSDAERLDPSNGLLLAAHLDAAFDQGFITFDPRGVIRFSPQLPQRARTELGFSSSMQLRHITPKHCAYLAWHAADVFRG